MIFFEWTELRPGFTFQCDISKENYLPSQIEIAHRPVKQCSRSTESKCKDCTPRLFLETNWNIRKKIDLKKIDIFFYILLAKWDKKGDKTWKRSRKNNILENFEMKNGSKSKLNLLFDQNMETN